MTAQSWPCRAPEQGTGPMLCSRKDRWRMEMEGIESEREGMGERDWKEGMEGETAARM